MNILKRWAHAGHAAGASEPRSQPASGGAEMRPLILLVAHDPGLVAWLQGPLTRAGFAVRVAHNRDQALAMARQRRPEVLLIERRLPGDALDLCHDLRVELQVPIVIMAAPNDQDDIIAALDGGADDVLTSSCPPAEAVARVRGIVRRAARPSHVLEQ
jgi:DNA-binding response OmpR family regulator